LASSLRSLGVVADAFSATALTSTFWAKERRRYEAEQAVDPATGASNAKRFLQARDGSLHAVRSTACERGRFIQSYAMVSSRGPRAGLKEQR
jgi:hypothetical protein